MWHQYVLAVIFMIAGLNHFRTEKIYLKIIPNAFRNKKAINFWAGFFEVLCGFLLLFDATASVGAYGIMAMLTAFFATHIFMIQNKEASLGLPKAILYIRLILQFGLIYWAFQYTKI